MKNENKIAYIEMNFPFVTTFMAAEMNHIRRMGVNITILPVREHSYEDVQSIYHELKDCVHYPPFFGLANIKAFLYYLIKKPNVLLSTLFEVVTSIRKPAKYIAQTWAILPKAIYVARYIEKNSITHVHGNWAHNPTTIAYIVKKLTGVSYSFSSHAGADIYRNTDMLEKKIEHSLFNMTCVRGNKSFLEKICDQKHHKKINVIYHGVDLSKFSFREDKKNKENPKIYKIISVGNLHEAKGFQHMVDACQFLKKWGIPFEYWIVGKGYMQNHLKSKIHTLNLEKYVKLKGQMLHRDLIQLYNEAHLFVMPSIVLKNGGRDGIPNVLIEAMGIGIPAIGSNAAGIPDVIVNGKTGLLVPPGDAKKLAETTKLALEDQVLRTQMAKNARKFVEQHFDRKKNVRLIYKLFKEKVLI